MVSSADESHEGQGVRMSADVWRDEISLAASYDFSGH